MMAFAVWPRNQNILRAIRNRTTPATRKRRICMTGLLAGVVGNILDGVALYEKRMLISTTGL
jgi:hypothetical protein